MDLLGDPSKANEVVLFFHDFLKPWFLRIHNLFGRGNSFCLPNLFVGREVCLFVMMTSYFVNIHVYKSQSMRVNLVLRTESTVFCYDDGTDTRN